MLFLWLVCNGVYFLIILNLPASTNPTVINDGSFAWLQGFTLLLAGIVMFRVIFSGIYILRWKIRFCCNKAYSVQSYNMEKVFRKIKKTANNGGMSSDDEEVIQRARKVYEEKRKRINKKKNLHDGMTERQKLEATLEYLHDQKIKEKKKQGKIEFNDAIIEEVEDKLIEERNKKGNLLNADDISRISKNVRVEDMNQSILGNVLQQDDISIHGPTRFGSTKSN